MSLSEVKEALDEISETINAWREIYGIDFSSSFNITGGEPLLRDDIFEILDELSKRKFDIYLLTNGTLIDKEAADRIASAGVKGVQVSIEGPEAVHDAIRGKGSYASSVSGVRKLLDAGLEVTLNVTLSKLNAAHFMDILKISSALKVQRVGFSRLVPSGRGKAISEKMLSTGSVKELYEKIFSMESGAPEIVTGDPVASQWKCGTNEKAESSVPSGGCAAGVSGITILSDGTLLPCRRLEVPIGNIRSDSLREVWAASAVLEALRDKKRYKGRCGTCKRWADCRGCRAIAFAHSNITGENDYLAEDPQCFLN